MNRSMSYKGITLLVIVMLFLAACGSTPSSNNASSTDSGSTKGKRTYFINPMLVGPAYWEAGKQGVLKAGKDLGVDVVFNGNNEVDSAKQINMISDMITRKVDGMAIAVNDAKSVTNVFDQAKTANIPVITWDSDSDGANRKYYVASDTDAAQALGMFDILEKQMGTKGNIAIMVSSLSAQNMIGKVDAVKKEIASKYPDIKVVATVASNDDQQVAFGNAQNLLKTYPDLNGFLCLAGGETPAAAEAVEQAVTAGQLKKGQIKIGGMSVPSLVKKYLKSGTLSEVLIWDPSKLGYASVYVLDQLAQGKAITDGMDIPYVGKIKVDGSNIFIGTFTFNAQTVDNYSF
ncbi:MAG: hypothetical protein JWM44_3253 [Bacilli bacterium]|nr:hypothetical protein [Bacilli bacterium]